MRAEEQRAFETAIVDGRLIEAIAMYRQITGASLADAKAYVSTLSNAVDTGATGPPPAPGGPNASSDPRWQSFAQLATIGRKIEAIKLYREITGAGLAESKAYVDAYAAALASGLPPPQPSVVSHARTAQATLLSRAAANTGGRIAGVLLLVFVLVGACVAAFVITAIKTHLFGVFTIVNRPYYPRVVARITSDPTFRDALGTPIVVDDAGVWCSKITSGNGYERDYCDAPVRGPRGDGVVHVKVSNDNVSFRTWLTLEMSGRTVKTTAQ